MDDEIKFYQSKLYLERVAEKKEIDLHKWYLSEKAGHDVGLNEAITDWTMHHRYQWIKSHRKQS